MTARERRKKGKKKKDSIRGYLVAGSIAAAVFASGIFLSGSIGGGSPEQHAAIDSRFWPDEPAAAAQFEQMWTTLNCDIADFRTGPPLSVAHFHRVFFGKQPVIFRNPSNNTAARNALGRDNLHSTYGAIPIKVATSGFYGHGGYANEKIALGDFLDVVAEWPPKDIYFFDTIDGAFLDSCSRLRGHNPFDTYSPPPQVTGGQWNGSRLRLTIGGAGTGIALHMHSATWNELFIGAKRWSLYGPGQAPTAGFTMGNSHLRWMQEVFPSLDPQQRPLGCVQRPGDVLYIPDGWLHATLNLRQTVSVANNAAFALPETAIGQQNQALQLMSDEKRDVPATRLHLEQAEAHMRRAVEMDPSNYHYYAHLAIALSKQGKYVEELKALRRGIECNKRSASLRNNMVLALLDLDRIMYEEGRTTQGPRKQDDYLHQALTTAVEAAEAGLTDLQVAPFGQRIGAIINRARNHGRTSLAREADQAHRRLKRLGLVSA